MDLHDHVTALLQHLVLLRMLYHIELGRLDIQLADIDDFPIEIVVVELIERDPCMS